MYEDFWQNIRKIDPTREANVETWLVLPLLKALGHDERNIDSKVPILFQEGRNKRPGRKPEADFVVYSESPFSRATSLITVETKRTDENLDEGREQAESYAQNQRTPILLMTNGLRLEVWQIQITTDSTVVFEADVVDLPLRRGDLETLLSKDSIKALCATIEFKNFDLVARDLGSYERAVHDRSAPIARSSIPRTLHDGSVNLTLSYEDLSTAQGALVVAASGYGKTTLANILVCESIERRWEGKSNALPFDLFLPNLTPGQAIEEFLAARVAAHKPGFSVSMLTNVAREHGLLVVADGFERVSTERRPDVERVLNTLLHDYPKSRLIIFSRANAAPISLGLKVLSLQGYKQEDLNILVKKRASTHPNATYAFSQAPDHVYRFGEVPLLADRLLERFEKQPKYTARIAPLFEQWLSNILASSQSVDRALDRSLLESIAEETARGPVHIERAVELAVPKSQARQILTRLAEADAVSIRGTVIELQHEMLADYLRSIRIWKVAQSSAGSAQIPHSFDTNSLFAILLIDTAPTARDRSAVWQLVAKMDVRLAIRSLRFAAGDETFDDVAGNADAERFLGDIINSINTLADAHFGPIANSLRAEIAGCPIKNLGIQGSISSDGAHYSFFDAEENGKTVNLNAPKKYARANKLYGHNMRYSGYGPEAGRILGVDRLKDALESLLKRRDLRGGPIWIEERVFGRLRHLAQRYGFVNPTGLLQDALDALVPQANSWVAGSAFRSGQEFSIGDLCDDVLWLIQQGKARVDPWWKDLVSLDLHTDDGQREFSDALNEYHRRRQLAYREIVEESFPALSSYLRNFRMMPMRMEIEVEFHTRRGYEDIALHDRRWPVEDYRDGGADVKFPKTLTDHHSEEAIRYYVSQTDSLLVSFGRFFPERVITWGGSMVPDFLGQDTTFNGLPDESAVVRGAMKWLEEDIKYLFSEMP